MIALVRAGAATGEQRSYAVEIGALWSSFASTLTRLDRLAAEPERLARDRSLLDSLPRLQYVLHAASEAVLGIDPPGDAERAHAEFASALGDARDLTAELYDAASAQDTSAILSLLYEWRGALFRVRLAHLRIVGSREPRPTVEDASPPASVRAALAATVLVLVGTAAFVFGALRGAWPLSAAGFCIFAAACLVYRGPSGGLDE